MDRLSVSEHDSHAGSWRVACLEPGGRLSPYVGGFYAYDECGTSFRRRRELPDGTAVLIFHLVGKLRVEHPIEARREFREGQGFYSGASTTYVVTETDGAQAGGQIKFSLPGARLFLGHPLEEFGDAPIDPSQAFGRSATELRDRLAETRSLCKRVEYWRKLQHGSSILKTEFPPASPLPSVAFIAPTFESRTWLTRSE